MLFCVKTPINKLYVFAMALLLAVTLAGCGGGGTTAAPPDETPMECPAGTTGTYPDCEPVRTQEQICTDDGGEWRNGACVTAEMLEEERMARAVAATKAAGTKADAIAAEAAQLGTAASPDAGLGGGGGVDANGAVIPVAATYSMTIERDHTGTTVKIEDSALAGDDDPKFMQAMDLGGGTTMHARAMAPDDDGNVVEEVVFVSTDIEAPTAVAFAKFVDVDGTATQALNVNTNTENDAPAVTNEALDVSGAITAHSSVTVSVIMAAGFSASGSGVQTYDGDDTDTADMDEAFETAGTYNGAMGAYRCDNRGAGGGSCTVTYDSDGKITAVSNGWVFTPAEGATSDQPDYDYYRYGFWLKKTTDADGAVTYNEVETFAGSAVAASGNVSTVTGQATYEGGAAGVYVKNVYNSDRTLDTATSGHFTADVSLTATFAQKNNDAGEGTIAPNLLNTLTGTIDNFTLSGGEGQMWSVDLAGAITATAGTAAGTAKGGDGDGSFSATFHGSVVGVDNVIPHPGSVVGEFNAGFTDGSIAGAFGAQRQ